jgi:uncharacterized protein (TIGR00369 family)
MSRVHESSGFLVHTGPLERTGPYSLGLNLQPHHLNIGGRLHGGMVMTLISAAAEIVARDAVLQTQTGAGIVMLSLDIQFISAALGGVRVRAEVTPTRVTRTMVFLTIRLITGDECLATAAAVYRIVPAGTECALPPMSVPCLEGWSPTVWREPFSQHIGPAYERTLASGLKEALFEAAPSRLCVHSPVLHDGMSLFMADVFTGRASSLVSGGRCVTLSMQVRRFGDVPAGAWAEFRPEVRQVSPSVVFTDGTLTCAGRPVMAVSSMWKVLGAT